MRTIIEGFYKNQFVNDGSFFSSTFTPQEIPRDQSHYRLSLRQRISFSVVPSLFFTCPRLAMLCKGE